MPVMTTRLRNVAAGRAPEDWRLLINQQHDAGCGGETAAFRNFCKPLDNMVAVHKIGNTFIPGTDHKRQKGPFKQRKGLTITLDVLAVMCKRSQRNATLVLTQLSCLNYKGPQTAN